MTLAWMEPSDATRWPVEEHRAASGAWRVGVPAAWPAEPQRIVTPLERTTVFRGPRATEWLTVSAQAGVDPGLGVRAWERAVRALSGGPSGEMWGALGADRVALLAWAEVGECAAAVGADEAVAWSGLARVAAGGAALARLYLVCARRDRQAVRAFLALDSACLPGTAEAVVRVNDHARAACVFGAFSLG